MPEPASESVGVSPDAIARAAAALATAAQRGRPTRPVRALIGDRDVGAAYAVQKLVAAARVSAGARIIGRKIGLTSAAVQAQVGVDQPDFGVLFDDMRFASGDRVPAGRLLQPYAEAEIAFVLRFDLFDPDVDHSAVRDSIDYAVAAIEVVDSRVEGWDIAITDTVADNASSGVFAVGEDRLRLRDFEPRDVTMTMTADEQLVSHGSGRACLGDPLIALGWLARTCARFGAPLRAGDLVLSGALGPMVPVKPGQTVGARIGAFEPVTISFDLEDTPCP